MLDAEKQIPLLQEFFKKIIPAGKQNYATLKYNGYHQHRAGCFEGSRSIYIDFDGDVDAPPFCHTKSYKIID